MCGIVGILGNGGRLDDSLSAITHRGPDGYGVWRSPCSQVRFGHRRLSILDVSDNGRQPMESADGRYRLTFNGEIYNFSELRKKHAGARAFKSGSDTEVMLATIESIGLEESVKQFDGMFAFGLWDEQTRQVHLVRDRIGIKPLYYGWFGNNSFAFASELHAFRALEGWNGLIDRNTLSMYMRYGYVPAPYSIYQQTYKLPPASILTLNVDEIQNRDNFSPFSDRTNFSPKRFWRVEDVYTNGKKNQFQGSIDEAVSASEDVITGAVQARMIADVPLGAFLSGGLDSTTIVTLMQKASRQPIKTFTIGVEGHTYDETNDAKRVTEYLGTDHTEHRISYRDALDVVPHLAEYYDEPFADSSQIPTYLLSKITRQHVTVALSGDGGDEVFGGYNRYIQIPKTLRRLRSIPTPLRRSFAYAFENGPWSLYGKALDVLSPILPGSINDRWLEITIPKVAALLGASSQREVYDSVTLLWPTDELVIGGGRTETLLNLADCTDFAEGSAEMRCLDLLSYHTDDILVKVDRASMAVSLEARVPFVDHHVIEFAATLPDDYLIQGGQGKWPLRQILRRHLPDDITFGTSKRGFSIPLADWLRGPLRDWAEDLLDESRIRQEGYLNAKLVRRTWDEHVSGKREWASRLWNVLMFQQFLEKHHPQGLPSSQAVSSVD